MTEDRAIAAVPDARPTLVTVRCPQCGKPLVRVTRGATVEVKCLKCKVWIKQEAA